MLARVGCAPACLDSRVSFVLPGRFKAKPPKGAVAARALSRPGRTKAGLTSRQAEAVQACVG
jgi:hypothetical protein